MSTITPAAIHRLQVLTNSIIDLEIVERDLAETVRAAEADLLATRQQQAAVARQLRDYLAELDGLELAS